MCIIIVEEIFTNTLKQLSGTPSTALYPKTWRIFREKELWTFKLRWRILVKFLVECHGNCIKVVKSSDASSTPSHSKITNAKRQSSSSKNISHSFQRNLHVSAINNFLRSSLLQGLWRSLWCKFYRSRRFVIINWKRSRSTVSLLSSQTVPIDDGKHLENPDTTLIYVSTNRDSQINRRHSKFPSRDPKTNWWTNTNRKVVWHQIARACVLYIQLFSRRASRCNWNSEKLFSLSTHKISKKVVGGREVFKANWIYFENTTRIINELNESSMKRDATTCWSCRYFSEANIAAIIKRADLRKASDLAGSQHKNSK